MIVPEEHQAGAVEGCGLGESVVHQMPRAREDPEAADAESQQRDPDVLDAGVGEQSLVVPLDQKEDRRDGERQQRQSDDQVPGKFGSHGFVRHGLEPQDRVDGEREHVRRQHRTHRRRRLGMRIREPGMHGREPRFRPVADQHEHEGQFDHGGIQSLSHPIEFSPAQRLARDTQHMLRRVVHEDRAKQGERDADRAENHIFPAGFQGRLAPVESDQHGRRESGALDSDPHDRDVLHIHGEHHGGEVQIEQAEKLAVASQ